MINTVAPRLPAFFSLVCLRVFVPFIYISHFSSFFGGCLLSNEIFHRLKHVYMDQRETKKKKKKNR